MHFKRSQKEIFSQGRKTYRIIIVQLKDFPSYPLYFHLIYFLLSYITIVFHTFIDSLRGTGPSMNKNKNKTKNKIKKLQI